MKLRINYDVMDKISEAKKGYSLKRCAKRVGAMFAISSSLSTMNNLIAGSDPRELLIVYPMHIAIHTSYTAMYTFGLSGITKSLAERSLQKLTNELPNICVRTNYESLLNTYPYKTKYRLDLDGKFPKVEQKKYMKIPVSDEYFGDREIPIVQEHIIGSRNYDLSFGEYEKKKVLVLGKTLMQR